MTVPETTMTVATSEMWPTAIRPLRLGHGAEVEDESTVTSSKILNIVYKYRLAKAADAHDKWVEGTPNFFHVIEKFVRAQSTVRMCMPAFPFKSANKNYKVLGTLPDRAEEVALARLNTMCAEIGAVYKPGARLLIISDGLVYNDLLTIPDTEVWAYGQELRAMAAKSYKHIEFSRLRELVSIQLPEQLEEVTYVANASNFRRALLNQFGKDGLDVNREIAEQEDTRLTYCGHSRFLFNDLQYIFPKSEARGSKKYKKDVKFLAREMIRRGFAFSAAIKKNFPDYLRLSIHQSTGEHKISLSLLPTKTSYTTPWMCAIAYRADGSLTSAPKGEFEADPKYQVVSVNGRPSFFEEKPTSAILEETLANDLNKANGAARTSLADDNKKKPETPSPCPHCGKTTHPESRCFDKYPHLAPQWIREKIASAKTSTPDIIFDDNNDSSMPVV